MTDYGPPGMGTEMPPAGPTLPGRLCQTMVLKEGLSEANYNKNKQQQKLVIDLCSNQGPRV
jgi:hypothetical protein